LLIAAAFSPQPISHAKQAFPNPTATQSELTVHDWS
jgi:hypothetical protein